MGGFYAAGMAEIAGRRRLGVEEEFHLVDLETRRLAPRAPELLARLGSKGPFVPEMQRCVVEVNSAVTDTLGELRRDLVASRERLVAEARELGLGIVAAGAVPLASPTEMKLTPTDRYRRMLADYQLLAREQLICGTQFHIDVVSRAEAVWLGDRVAAYLPTLLALSASSPYNHHGADTGYASGRTLAWIRWPTTGLTSGTTTEEDFDAQVEALVESGIITDEKMIYFDTRPTMIPTLELRICDSCPSIDTIVLIAGLFRALCDRERRLQAEGVPKVQFSPALGRAAIWRAARSGLEGDLVDLSTRTRRPAGELVNHLADSLKDELVANGDWDLVCDLLDAQLIAGSSAARQRRAMRRRGRLTDVVDLLMAETSRTTRRCADRTDAAALIEPYQPDPNEEREPRALDEAIDPTGRPIPLYSGLLTTAQGLGAPTLRRREARMEDLQRADGVTFRATGQQTRVFPLDVIPRVIPADHWDAIDRGCAQRAKALDAFLNDVYTTQQIVKDGIVPQWLLDNAPGYRSTGLLPRGVRAHICGLDVVTAGDGSYLVLEDNLRVPSGLAYALWNRELVQRFVPELAPPAPLVGHDTIAATLLETLVRAAPARCEDNPKVVILTSGTDDSAYSEHAELAARMGIPLVFPEHLLGGPGTRLVRRTGATTTEPVDVVYARMGEDMFLSSTGSDGVPLREAVIAALHRETLTVANAFGNGVGDDKAVYALVPQMIDYYLGEKPILANIPTYLCADREQRDHVLANLDKLVTKPIDGLGGSGVVIGPDSTEAQLEERRVELLGHPERYIAQDTVNLSTVPAFDGQVLQPRHVDLRVFTHLRSGPHGTEAVTLPAALTRVAAAGSRIVNSSAGGGSKDTWILGS